MLRKPGIVCLALAALVVFIGLLAEGGWGVADSRSGGVSAPSVEVRLASVQNQEYAADDDPLVGQFKQQLDMAEPRCTETRLQLADLAVLTHDQLAKSGVQESHLSILADVTAAIPDAGPRLKCAEVFATYQTLRTSR